MKFCYARRDGSPHYNQTVSEEVLMQELFGAKTIAFDVETIGLKDRTPIGFALATSPYDAFYFPPDSPYIHMIMETILANTSKKKIAHNAMFDVDVVYKTWNVMASPCEDTMLMCAHLNRPLQLQQAAMMVGRGDVTSASSMLAVLKKSDRSMLHLDQSTVAEKCCIDAQVTFALFLELESQCDYEPYHIDRDLIPTLVKVQARGMKVDQDVRAGIQEILEDNIKYYKAICDGMGFNPGSPLQVAYVLADRGVTLPMKWDRRNKKMHISTREEILAKLSDPVAQLVLLYRQDTKLNSTYVMPLENADRAFTHLHMSTITGRLGSANMNLQNWPEKIRMMLLPDDDVFTIADASQIELRVLAHVSGDKVMAEVFANPDGDIHAETMKALDITDRRIAKATNFGMVYGAQASTIDELSKCGLGRAAEFMEKWFDVYKGARDWIFSTQESAKSTQHVFTPMGRKIYVPEFGWPDKMSEALRKAINYPIQAGAAEISKKSMPLLDHLDLRLQVHDNFVINGRAELPDLEHVVDMWTPYKVTYTDCWE